jgi:hypothetical protein
VSTHNGSVKAFPGRLALQDHQALAATLLAVRGELDAVGAVLARTLGEVYYPLEPRT